MRVLDGVEYRAIAGAAAEHTGERVLDRLFVRPRLSSQESYRGEQNARRADAALHRAMGMKGRAQLSDNRLAVAETLNRFDRTPVDLSHAGQTGANRLAVDEDRACATIASVAAYLDARKAAFLAQSVTEAIERRSGNSRRAAVEAD